MDWKQRGPDAAMQAEALGLRLEVFFRKTWRWNLYGRCGLVRASGAAETAELAKRAAEEAWWMAKK